MHSSSHNYLHKRSSKLSFEQRLFWLSLLGALPSSIFLIWLLQEHQYSGYMITLVILYLIAHIGICAYQIRFSIITQFRTLTNLLEALTNDDYSLRGRRTGKSGALNELVAQINSLSELLARQRFTVKETQLLLAKVIAHIDVAVFTFDPQNRLTLVNRAGADLYQKDIDELHNMSISKLGLEGMLARNGQVVELTFGKPGLSKEKGVSTEGTQFHSGRFHISTDQFIERNEHHTLLFLTNVHAALREEERKAWQNLIRVISHELNNSLSPIASISQTLMQMSLTDQDVLKESLGVINERANSLSAFIKSYQQLAKLPAPNLQNLDIRAEIEQVTVLFPDVNFEFRIGSGNTSLQSDATEKLNQSEITADPAQLRQLLINLFKNAQEASKQVSKDANVNITIGWKKDKDYFTLSIKDNGPGIKNPENIFVPFYSTKPGGSGIGLLLCRQIAEGHGGQLSLTNAKDGGGLASLRIPG